MRTRDIFAKGYYKWNNLPLWLKLLGALPQVFLFLVDILYWFQGFYLLQLFDLLPKSKLYMHLFMSFPCFILWKALSHQKSMFQLNKFIGFFTLHMLSVRSGLSPFTFLWTKILPDDAGIEQPKRAVVSNKHNIHNEYSCVFWIVEIKTQLIKSPWDNVT